MIKNNMNFYGVKEGDAYEEYEDEGIISDDWYKKYANGYLEAFENELKRRKKV